MLICALTLRNLQKTAKRVIGRFGWTAVFLLVLLPRSLNTIQNIHTYKIYSFERLWRIHLFFLYSFQQHLPCWCYTTSDSRETVWKHWGEDRFHRIKTSDGPGTVILLCFYNHLAFPQRFSRKKISKRLVEHLVELKCNIAFKEFQRDKKRSTYNCVTRC